MWRQPWTQKEFDLRNTFTHSDTASAVYNDVKRKIFLGDYFNEKSYYIFNTSLLGK